MCVVVSHLTGNSNVKAALNGLQEANLLTEFHVSMASFPGSWTDKLGGINAFSEIRRRRFESSIKPITKTWPLIEAGRVLAPKIGLSRLVQHEKGPFYIDTVVRKFDRRVASKLGVVFKRGAKAVYTYEDIALYTFREARKLGLQCFYDLPIGYWRSAHRLLRSELEAWPDWANTLQSLRDPETKLAKKDEELSLANLILVASSFTASTLQEYPGILPKIEVIPYGFPPVYEYKRHYNHSRQKPLKLLFVGSLSQRKGLANLFSAIQQFEDHVELTIVGKQVCNNCKPLNTALVKHKWISSLSHEEILALMRENDVLVFPSNFEGFGLVITEAMSQGMPVITTERTAGPDLIEHGRSGWLIPAGSVDALRETVENLLTTPKLINEYGREAIQVAKRRPWSIYGKELAEKLKKYLD